jgi:hypothetical protein
MNALLYWLRLGLAAFLAFGPPSLRVDGGAIVASLETEHLLTQEMRELVEGGVPLSFELYCSARVTTDGGTTVFVTKRLRRSIHYDYLRQSYLVEEGEKTLCETAKLDSAEAVLKRYDALRLELGGGWKSASLFFELSCLGDPLLEDRFGKDGSSLWGGYSPSIKVVATNSGGGG